MEVNNISHAVNKFGLSLFKLMSKGKTNENNFLSPFSISVALAMTQLGAAGSTASSMSKALQWNVSDETTIHTEFKKYLTILQKSCEKYLLATANRLYVDEKLSVTQEFQRNTKDLYSAESVLAHFWQNPESERLNINNWVSEQTHGKIKDLIGEGVLSILTRMVLVNAIYFKGQWGEKFTAPPEYKIPFKISPAASKSVSMMSNKGKYRYFSDDKTLKCQVLDIPYRGYELSMVVILPLEDFGLEELEEKLSSETLESIFAKLDRTMVTVKVVWPKFEITSSFLLSEPLSSLGMADAFRKDANFSRITGSPELFLSEVVHKAFIKVDEEGTEAAAATAVMARNLCLITEKPPETFIANHPFLFVIRDERAGNTVLFMGRVADPTRT